LLHGMRDHCRTWDWVAQGLRDRYHIVAPDLRGHGDSQWAAGSGYAHTDYVYDVAQLIHQTQLAPVTIIAHSMGGTLACLYAGLYPERVKKLVIVEGVGHWWRFFERPPAQQQLRAWIDGMRAQAGRSPRRYASLEEAFQRMQHTNGHLTPEQARHLTVHGSHQNGDGTYTWKFDNYTHAGSPYEFNMEDARDLWNQIRCPILVIYGDESWGRRFPEGLDLSAFHDYRLVKVGNAGHWVHHDQFDTVLGHVNGFLAE
jgi:pimeloyl-ACP methyl ester carboxylesterase